MNHAELSFNFAEALGWPAITLSHRVLVADEHQGPRDFDYRHPTVWGPVLEWLMREHDVWILPQAEDEFCVDFGARASIGHTLPEAVARAAIAVGAK